MDEVERIRKNAQLVIDTIGPLSEMGAQFGYNRESVAWVEGYIDRQRESGHSSKEDIYNLTQVFGSWLGECVIHVYGGAWRPDNGTWGVFFDDKNAVFPFRFVAKQFDGGMANGDSILSKFDVIGLVMLNKPAE
jgi:hypothetical protein